MSSSPNGLPSCLCECHGRWQRPCSVEGGCGHLHQQQDETDHAHRCARERRCAARERVTKSDGDKTWVGARIDDERGFCGTCRTHLAEAVGHLPRDYVELHTLLGVGGGAVSDRIRASKDLPIPIRLGIKTVQEAIVAELDTWIEPVAEQLSIDWPSTTQQRMSSDQYRVQRAAAVIANAVDTLLALPGQEIPAWDVDGMPIWDEVFDCHDSVTLDGLDGALRLLRLHELTRAVAGRTELVHRMPAPCPRCSRLALVRANGDSNVHCEACKDTWTEDDYQRLCLVLASDERRRIRLCDMCDRDGRLPDRTPCAHEVEGAA